MGKGIIFISCGQRTHEERQLGSAIEDLVRQLTPFDPYFAEYQHTLDGLVNNIFAALNKATGLIAIMHRRGNVDFRDTARNVERGISRASVWVEQELAITAFLEHISARKIYVEAFAQKGINREGVREQLLLNPTVFETSDEVLDRLRQILPKWGPAAAQSEVEIKLTSQNVTVVGGLAERHLLELSARNLSLRRIGGYWVELEIPLPFLIPGRHYLALVQERTSASHAFFRATQENTGRPLYPHDLLRILSVEYVIHEEFFVTQAEFLDAPVRARFYADGIQPVEHETTINRIRTYFGSVGS